MDRLQDSVADWGRIPQTVSTSVTTQLIAVHLGYAFPFLYFPSTSFQILSLASHIGKKKSEVSEGRRVSLESGRESLVIQAEELPYEKQLV